MRQTAEERELVPEWLSTREDYCPPSDRDSYLTRNLLQLSSLLARFRLDDGRADAFGPSTPVKLLTGVVSILLVSLTRNYFFVLVMLALTLARTCLLPPDKLRRLAATAGLAAALTALVMLPASLMGQPRSLLWLATKSLVSTSITLLVALTTPVGDITGTLRAMGMPASVILATDLALRSIVRLGETAHEVLTALSLRSVGRNRDKGSSMGGVGGVVFLKASRTAQDTYDAMRCRGFDGTYQAGRVPGLQKTDILWVVMLACLVALFVYLQKGV